MNLERLNRLSEYLRTVPQEQFYMGVWISQNECGTVGCALGWACQLPEFNKEGLHATMNYRMPTYKRFVGFEAGMHFFGLTDKQAINLFAPGAYLAYGSTTPANVADRIDDWLCDEIRRREQAA